MREPLDQTLQPMYLANRPSRWERAAVLVLPANPHMVRRAVLLAVVSILTSVPAVDAAQYKVVITRLDANLFEAKASKVVIQTRRCGDWTPEDEEEEAILNWEGSFGNNWILFTASGTRCDVATIR